MKKKQLVGVALAAVLAGSTLAGCHKDTGRPIEGASDDSRRLVRVVEEAYEMPGVSLFASYDVQSEKAKGILSMTFLEDRKENMQWSVGFAGRVMLGEKETAVVQPALAKVAVVDDVLYADLTGLYQAALGVFGGQLLQNAGKATPADFPVDDIRAIQHIKIPLKDIEVKGLERTSWKPMVQALTNEVAVAITQKNILERSNKSYAMRLEAGTVVQIAQAFVASAAGHKDTIYDAMVSWTDVLQIPKNLEGLRDLWLGGLRRSVEAAGDDAQKEAFADWETNLRTQVDEGIEKLRLALADLKIQRATNLEKVPTALTEAQEEALRTHMGGLVYLVNVEDNKDGYDISIEFQKDMETQGPTLGLHVTEYKEEIQPMEGTDGIFDVIRKYVLFLGNESEKDG